MSWKHLEIDIDESYGRICDGVELLVKCARGAFDVGLLSRTTADRRKRVLLLTPKAVELAGEALSHRWTECECPELFEWDLVVGPAELHEVCGLAPYRVRPADSGTPIVKFE